MKRKQPPRSLFKPTTIIGISTDDAEAVKTFFASMPSNEELLGKNLATIRTVAEKAAQDKRVARGRYYRDEIIAGIRDLRLALKRNDAPLAALWGLRLAELWMELRIDALFARDVRDAEVRHSNLRHSPTVTDDQIENAIRQAGTRRAAAKQLGISERHLRRRVAKKKADA